MSEKPHELLMRSWEELKEILYDLIKFAKEVHGIDTRRAESAMKIVDRCVKKVVSVMARKGL